MKIAIDARIIATSTGRYVDRLVEHLQAIDKENQYVVLLRRQDFDAWQPKAANFTKQIADYPPFTFREQINFSLLLYRLGVDLVHFTSNHYPVFYFKPHVVTIHDTTLIDYVSKRGVNPLSRFYKYTIKPVVFRLVLKFGLRGARHVITPTDFVRQRLHTRVGLPLEKITFTHEASEPPLAHIHEYKPMKGKRFILYVGNAYPYKNLSALTDAFKLLDDPSLHLVLAGRPEFFYEQLKRDVYVQNIKQVHFAGFVSDAELGWLYKHAALYVFPSLSEGFGLPGVEAMANGLPVASSASTCLPEVYGDAAVYFDPNDTHDMARVIGDTLKDPKALAHLKAAGITRSKSFSWRRTAEQTHTVYLNALSKSK